MEKDKCLLREVLVQEDGRYQEQTKSFSIFKIEEIILFYMLIRIVWKRGEIDDIGVKKIERI